MRTTSNRELARQIGVSETAVRRAEKAGRIRREADGAWDIARVRAQWSRNTDRAQQRRQHGAMRPVPNAAVGAVRATLREHGEPAAAGSMTFMQARTANEVLKAQTARLRLQRMKGELVDRAKAVAQVFKLARDERDAWVNWPARVAAMIAAEVEVDQHRLHTVLERSVRNTWRSSPSFGRACVDVDAYDGAEAIERAWRDGLKPDPLLTVSEWADRHRVLSQRASSEPGRWRTARTPYLKEIMDCLSPSSPVQRVVFMKGSQTGGTEAGNGWIGYVIHQAPGPMMAVAPTVELAKRNSKQRIDPLIEESEVLRERVKERRSRDSGNTVLSKEFPGGVLILTGANSAVGLRSMPARYLFLDEVDGYPGDVEGEGDPILLAERRSATFQRRKILLVSTPKTKGLSRIEREYEASDQRRFFLPCPHCGEHQTLEFENLRWPEGRPREAEYVCRHCDAPIGERHKTWMLEHGEWRPTGESDGRTAGFHLSSLYSPVGWFSWADAAEMYEQAKKTPDLMKGFVNTVLGLPFEDEAEAPEWQRLYERREACRIGTVPEPGLFLTAGVDVQKDRIEVEIVAWGRGKESWSVDYRVIEGDTARPEVWAKLDEALRRDWPHASGHTLPIRVMCVDAGYATQDVYAWVRQHPQASWGPAGAAARQPRTAVAVKGRDRDTALLLSVSKADAGGRRRGLRVWSVGTPVAKGELYRWLKLEWPTEEALAEGADFPPGACHFPQYGEEYFKQLTAERLVTRIVKGFPRASWEKEPGRRNEALDCRVYARAAAAIFGLDRFDERHWRRMETALARSTDGDEREPLPRPPSVREPARRVIHSGYMAR